MRTRPIVLVTLGAALSVLALAGCGGSSGGGATTPTTATTGTTTTATSGTTTASPQSPTAPTATSSPSTVTDTPVGPVKAMTLSVTSAVAAPGQPIGFSVSTDPSLAGKQVAITKTTGSEARIISVGATIGADGTATGYLVLQQSGTIAATVPSSPVTVGPYTPVPPLAESQFITMTIG